LYLREVCGREEGAPPPVDLAAERKAGDLVRGLIGDGVVTAVHDVSDGGILIAIAEMAMASGIGARLERATDLPPHAFWFGEDQGRYVVTARRGAVAALTARARDAGASLCSLGVTAGDALTLPGERPMLVANLRARFEGWLPAYMSAAPA